MKPNPSAQKFIALAMGLVGLAALIAALFNIGSPAENRLLKLDERRINDLNNLDSCVRNYWSQEKDLPADLAALKEWGRCYNADLWWTDPETREPYGYEKGAPDRYKLCATFSRPGQGEPYWPSGLWQHPAGKHCFEQAVNANESENLKGLRPYAPLVD